MIDNSKEYIAFSAIWYQELEFPKQDIYNPYRCKNTDKGTIFIGQRHPHCMYLMVAITGKPSSEHVIGKYIQGFVTSKNRFLNREEAAKLAIECGQIEKLQYSSTELFSEDLY